MAETVLAFFKGDELFAIACILPLGAAVVMVMVRSLVKLATKMFRPTKSNNENYSDAEYHKEIATELFVPPTQIDTPY